MISTGRIQTATTAAKMKKIVDEIREEAADVYGRGTREYEATMTLLESDVKAAVERQIKYLNELATRYTRECAEWLALMPHA